MDDIPGSASTEAYINVDSEYTNIDSELEKEKLKEAKLRNEALEEENKGESQDRGQRKDFAERVFSFASIYMLGVFMILFLSGTNTVNFHLSDDVLIMLLGTTTANVIGILIIVVTYLFSRNRRKK